MCFFKESHTRYEKCSVVPVVKCVPTEQSHEPLVYTEQRPSRDVAGVKKVGIKLQARCFSECGIIPRLPYGYRTGFYLASGSLLGA